MWRIWNRTDRKTRGPGGFINKLQSLLLTLHEKNSKTERYRLTGTCDTIWGMNRGPRLRSESWDGKMEKAHNAIGFFKPKIFLSVFPAEENFRSPSFRISRI
ncbi:hypothetical protein LEP1GSC061_1579 [Leptospira wolffii serovar Khorat str. Khorat-H2]|nr:hypothetical protein LEP1GSC061_1579 [Leptospira wolffii serovar Khorat str. Khorat-H2]